MKNNLMKFIKIMLIAAIAVSSNVFNVLALNGHTQKGVELKEATNEEIKERDENFFKDFEKSYEISEKEDEKLYKQNLEIFKDFKKQDYEIKGFNLEIYKKRGVPILVYEHETTKAKIVFVPIDNVDESLVSHVGRSELTDSYFFRATEQNNKGLIHIAEHCLYSNEISSKINKKFKDSSFNASTSPQGFAIIHNSTFSGEELENEIFKILLKPDVLENEKNFEIEKRRAIIEMTNDSIGGESNELASTRSKESYIFGGTPEEMEKVTLNEIKAIYKKYFNPSNLLITKFVKLNTIKIKSFLERLQKNYLKHFNGNEKVNFKKNNSIKQKPFQEIEVSYRPQIFTSNNLKGKIEKNKYLAEIKLFDRYDLEDKIEKDMKFFKFLNEYETILNVLIKLKINFNKFTIFD